MKKILAVVVAMGFAGVAFAGEHAGKAMEHAGKPMEAKKPAASTMSWKTAKWEPMGDPKEGPWMAVVHGDPKSGAYAAYFKLKAGMKSPWHTHDADYAAVVLDGVATHQDQGGPVLTAKAGESWVGKGGVNHMNTCVGKKDCVLFMHSAGPMSFTMMTADGKKMEQPAAATKTN